MWGGGGGGFYKVWTLGFCVSGEGLGFRVLRLGEGEPRHPPVVGLSATNPPPSKRSLALTTTAVS